MKVQLGLADQQQRQGRPGVAAVHLEVFLAQARAVRDVPARTLLTAVGQDLKNRLLR
jgi:hypothetical protein